MDSFLFAIQLMYRIRLAMNEVHFFSKTKQHKLGVVGWSYYLIILVVLLCTAYNKHFNLQFWFGFYNPLILGVQKKNKNKLEYYLHFFALLWFSR